MTSDYTIKEKTKECPSNNTKDGPRALLPIIRTTIVEVLAGMNGERGVPMKVSSTKEKVCCESRVELREL